MLGVHVYVLNLQPPTHTQSQPSEALNSHHPPELSTLSLWDPLGHPERAYGSQSFNYKFAALCGTVHVCDVGDGRVMIATTGPIIGD